MRHSVPVSRAGLESAGSASVASRSAAAPSREPARAAAFKDILAQRQVPVGAERTLKAEYLAGPAPRWDGSK
jgi:hypothetical protein